jgi:ribosome maturation protein SDO1
MFFDGTAVTLMNLCVCADKERGAIQENLTKDVATIVADKCVNPTTKRPYPVSIIITALKDTHFSVNLAKSAKQQALKAVETLAAHIPIERAKMRVRINVPLSGKLIVS